MQILKVKNVKFSGYGLTIMLFGLYLLYMNTVWKNCLISVAAALIFTGSGCGEPSPALLMEEAKTAAVNGDWQKITEITEQLEELAPADPNTWLFKSLAMEEAGNMPEAVAAAARGAELCPESFYCLYNYGRLLFADGNNDQTAFQYLARAFRVSPENTDCLMLLVQCAARLNTDPSSFYTKLSQLAPEIAASPEIQSSLGVYFVSNNQPGTEKWLKGMVFLQNAYNALPGTPVTALNFARALDQLPRYQQSAVPIYEKYLQLVSNNPEAAGAAAEAEARIRAIKRGSR